MVAAFGGIHWVFLVVLVAEGGQRLFELLVSRRRQTEQAQSGVQPVRERAWYFMVATHALLFLAPPIEIIVMGRPFVWTVALPALAVLGLAKGLRYWALSTLGKSWNARVLAPHRVVTEGPYRFIRHPNYLVVVIELAVIPLVHSAWLSAVLLSVLNGMVLLARIQTEEKTLFALPGYREAMGPKARFVPGLF
jgi:methyltransferase